MQVPRGLFSVTCTGTRARTPASGPRTLLSAKSGNIRAPPSISNPLHVPTLERQAVLPGTQDRRPHPVTGTSNKEGCEQKQALQLLQPHSSALSLALTSQLSSVLLVPGRDHPCSSGPSLHPQPQSQAPDPPFQLAGLFLSRKRLFLACCKQCFHLGILSCSVFPLRVVCGLVSCLLPSRSPPPLLSALRGPVAYCHPNSTLTVSFLPAQPPRLSHCPWLSEHTGFGPTPHTREASDPPVHGLEAQLSLSPSVSAPLHSRSRPDVAFRDALRKGELS